MVAGALSVCYRRCEIGGGFCVEFDLHEAVLLRSVDGDCGDANERGPNRIQVELVPPHLLTVPVRGGRMTWQENLQRQTLADYVVLIVYQAYKDYARRSCHGNGIG